MCIYLFIHLSDNHLLRVYCVPILEILITGMYICEKDKGPVSELIAKPNTYEEGV